jgi:hypothetical protein
LTTFLSYRHLLWEKLVVKTDPTLRNLLHVETRFVMYVETENKKRKAKKWKTQ